MIRRKCRKFLILMPVLALLFVQLPAVPASADMVTDTLSVKAGYYGTDTADYADVATYNWAELENDPSLPKYETAYSYYQDSNSVWSKTGDYNTIVVAAYGFYIEDLLAYANIDINSVESISFYTLDRESGAFVNFTSDELFGERYYFKDLGWHLKFAQDSDGNILYDDSAQLIVDESEAWSYSSPVRPMLALESYWESYSRNADEIMTVSTPPNYSQLSPSSRFRLLFGQSSPGETGQTSHSAKYVHTLYVTLRGAPQQSGEEPAPDMQIGTHSLTMDMTVDNAAILQKLSDIARFYSSDESILRVTGWVLRADEEYSDIVHVTIRYEVIAEGNAEIIGTAGSGSSLVTLRFDTEAGTVETERKEESAVETGSIKTDSPTASAEIVKIDNTSTDAASEHENVMLNYSADSAILDVSWDDIGESVVAPAESTGKKATMEGKTMYKISEDMLRKASAGESNSINSVTNNSQNVQLVITQNTDRLQQYLLYTGISALLICICGAAVSLLLYRKQRR